MSSNGLYLNNPKANAQLSDVAEFFSERGIIRGVIGHHTSTYELSELNDPRTREIEPFSVAADSPYLLGRAGQKLLTAGGRPIQEIGHRIKWILHSGVTVLSTGIDGLIGAAATVGSILTGGAFHKLNEVADTRLRGAELVVSNLFYDLIRVINPRSEIVRFDSKKDSFNPALLSNKPPGVSQWLTRPLINEIREIVADENRSWFARHVVARVDSVLLLGATVIGRIAELAIGVIAAIGALFTLGMCPILTSLAYEGLRLPVSDLVIAFRSIINPQSLPEPISSDF